MGERGDNVQTCRYTIKKSVDVRNTLVATVNNTVLPI